jgi:hypothetical protein
MPSSVSKRGLLTAGDPRSVSQHLRWVDFILRSARLTAPTLWMIGHTYTHRPQFTQDGSKLDTVGKHPYSTTKRSVVLRSLRNLMTSPSVGLRGSVVFRLAFGF